MATSSSITAPVATEPIQTKRRKERSAKKQASAALRDQQKAENLQTLVETTEDSEMDASATDSALVSGSVANLASTSSSSSSTSSAPCLPSNQGKSDLASNDRNAGVSMNQVLDVVNRLALKMDELGTRIDAQEKRRDADVKHSVSSTSSNTISVPGNASVNNVSMSIASGGRSTGDTKLANGDTKRIAGEVVADAAPERPDIMEMIAAAAAKAQLDDAGAPATGSEKEVTNTKKEGKDLVSICLMDIDHKARAAGSLYTHVTSKYSWNWDSNRQEAVALAYIYDRLKKNDVTGAFRHLNKRIAKIFFCDCEELREPIPELDSCDADEALLSVDTRAEIMTRVVRIKRLEQQADRFTGRSPRVSRGASVSGRGSRGRGRGIRQTRPQGAQNQNTQPTVPPREVRPQQNRKGPDPQSKAAQ